MKDGYLNNSDLSKCVTCVCENVQLAYDQMAFFKDVIKTDFPPEVGNSYTTTSNDDTNLGPLLPPHVTSNINV